MGVNYEVPAGKVFMLHGPAMVVVNGSFEEPLVVDSTDDVGTAAPVIDTLTPDTAEIGSDPFTLVVAGQNLTAQSVIVFAGYDEPTTLAADGLSVSTGINMDVWLGADTIDVQVRNGPAYSNHLEFTFTDPGAAREGAQSTKREHAKPPRRKRKR